MQASDTTAAGADGSFLLAGGRLIDGIADEPREDVDVLVRDGRIVALPSSGADRADGATVIDLRGATVLPGLIDAHVHLVGWRSVDQARFIAEPRELRTIRAAADLRVLLEHGFTTVRDMGSADGIHLRQAVAEGTLVGPRILSAYKMICQTGGNGDMMATVPPERLHELGWLATLADGVDECRRVARRMLRAGADFIKICTSGGGASERGGALEVQFTLPEVEAMALEAHRAGVKVAAHAHNLESIHLALDGGADTIEHGSDIDVECARRMADEGIPLVATIVNIKAFAEQGEALGVAPPIVEKARESLRRKGESMMLAFEQGVTIVHGADTGGAPPAIHGINAGNLTQFVLAGMRPMDAILGATRNAAQALGLEDQIGTVEVGKVADLLVVNGDPLHDIAILEQPERLLMVIKDGQVVVDRGEAHLEALRNALYA